MNVRNLYTMLRAKLTVVPSVASEIRGVMAPPLRLPPPAGCSTLRRGPHPVMPASLQLCPCNWQLMMRPLPCAPNPPPSALCTYVRKQASNQPISTNVHSSATVGPPAAMRHVVSVCELAWTMPRHPWQTREACMPGDACQAVHASDRPACRTYRHTAHTNKKTTKRIDCAATECGMHGYVGYATPRGRLAPALDVLLCACTAGTSKGLGLRRARHRRKGVWNTVGGIP